MKLSVICCIYNNLPLVSRTLEALLRRTSCRDAQIVLVDNHGPDSAARDYIRELAKHEVLVSVEDPGRNLGCHGGWNYGFDRSEGEFVVKLDDDTEIATPSWDLHMIAALETIPRLAYLSADIDAKQRNKYRLENHSGIELEVPEAGIVGFSCVMFRRADLLRWGPMRTGAYRTAGGKVIRDDRLYGGEEVYMAQLAREEDRFYAHFPKVFCHHMDNNERDPDYAMWKRVYGFHGWTNKDMETWRKDGDHIHAYAKCLQIECAQNQPNDVLLRDWTTRLGEVGDTRHVTTIAQVKQRTKNQDVLRSADIAIARLIG